MSTCVGRTLTLLGGAGLDTLRGESGNDTLDGQAGNDELDGGIGNDRLSGGSGADVYHFGKGSGTDYIINSDSDVASTNPDTILLGAGITSTDLTFKRFNDDLLIRINGTEDQLQVKSYFLNDGASSNVVENLKFASGVVWDYMTVKANASLLTTPSGMQLVGNETSQDLVGGQGNDTLNGQAGNDTLDGGAGDDSLYGGSGNDTFLFGRGAGQDTVNADDIQAGKIDAIRIGAGVQPSDLTLTISGDDLVLSINGTSDKLRVYRFFYQYPGNQVEQIEFAEGTIWDLATIRSKASRITNEHDLAFGSDGDNNISSLSGNDTVYAHTGNDTVTGGIGNDSLHGEDGSDLLQGGSERDSLYGGNGDDTLDGGSGDDYLVGGAGIDTYLFGKGSGHDQIATDASSTAKLEIIKMGEDVAPADVLLVRENSALRVILNSGDSLAIGSYFSGYPFEQIKFADGTTWDADIIKAKVLLGSDRGDLLLGYGNADTISGLAGDDSVYGDAGNDELSGGIGLDSLYGEDGNDTIQGGSQNDRIDGGNGADSLQGQDGNDELFGQAGNDTLDGGAGDDTLDGGAGSDTYLFGRGAGKDVISSADTTASKVDVIQLGTGILASDIALKRENDALLLSIKGGVDSLRINNYFVNDASSGSQIEQIKFADATVWDIGTVKAKVLTATDGDDALFGYATSETFAGQMGDDILYGRAGNDVIDGGLGADSLYGDDGDDVLLGDGQDDLLHGGNGSDNLQGQSGDDTLFGDAGNDTLDGGAGNDELFGQEGNDRYKFGRGSGQDTIYPSDGALDVIELGAGILPSDVIVTRPPSTFSLYGGAITLSIKGTSDTLSINGYFYDETGQNQIGQIIFADGTIWTVDVVKSKLLQATSEDDALYGYAAAELISGLAGDDQLYGNAGNDTLDGGEGSDSLSGEAGDDTFVFGRYGGNDTILGWSASSQEENTLQFKDGITISDISTTDFKSSGLRDLRIATRGTSDTIQINSFFSSSYAIGTSNPIQRIQFADGVAWDAATLLKFHSSMEKVNPLTGAQLSGGVSTDRLRGLQGSDTLIGLAGGDFLMGGANGDSLDGGADDDWLYGEDGNDTLLGGDGADVLSGGIGQDVLYGGAGADTYIYNKGDGYDIIYGQRAEDTLVMKGFKSTDVTFNRRSSDIDIGHTPSGTSYSIVTLVRQAFDGAHEFTGVSNIVFDDKTITADDIRKLALIGSAGHDTNLRGYASNDSISGGGGNDWLYGDAGNDTLEGGTGVDMLYGDAGADTYIYNKGDGYDVIYGQRSEDTLRMKGFNSSDVTFRRRFSDIDIAEATSGAGYSILTLVRQAFDSTHEFTGVSQIIFDDKTLTADEIRKAALQGTAGNDANLRGYASNDTISGFDGNDSLYGEGGDDKLYGGLGSDLLDGGTGNDYLDGNKGNDTYLFSRGSGSDTIYDADATVGNADVLQFQPGIAHDQLWFTQSGGNLTISVIGTTDSIKIAGGASALTNFHVEQFTAGGKTLSDTKVANLVQAMASMTPPATGQTTLTDAQRTQLAPVLAASWG